MKQIPFIKMHGLGNNYIYIDCEKYLIQENILQPLAKAVSDVNMGIGSDGLIYICPSDKADIKMRIFNKDGSEGKNCGNGLRCVAKYVYEEKIVASKNFSIETLSGIVSAHIVSCDGLEAKVTINMGKPRLQRSKIPMIGTDDAFVINEPFKIDNKNLNITCVSMGNPHAVFFVPSRDHSLHYELGPLIEVDPRFPEKINVEFVSIDLKNSLTMKVWERGSGVTMACGTGACASVVAAILNGYMKKGENITVHLEGGDLQIEWKDDILMTGPATTIGSGFFNFQCSE